MMVVPEFIVENNLRTAFALLNDEPQALGTEVLCGLDDTRLEQVLTWLVGGGITQVQILKGYPSFPPSAPAVYIVLAGSNETGQMVGETATTQEAGADETPFTETRGAYFESTVRLICITTSADWTIYLAEIVRWALLSGRVEMEGYGLTQQRVQLTDLAPVRELQPDIVFGRDVNLSATHLNTWQITYAEAIPDEVRVTIAGDPPFTV